MDADDRLTDLEMPSVKRMRLEAPERAATQNLAAPVNDTDDLCGTPPECTESPNPKSLVHTPIHTAAPPPMVSKPLHLPGLGLLKEDTALSNGLRETDAGYHPLDTPAQIPKNAEESVDPGGTEQKEILGTDEELAIVAEHESAVTVTESSLGSLCSIANVSQLLGVISQGEGCQLRVPEEQTLAQHDESELDTSVQEYKIDQPGNVMLEETHSNMTSTPHEVQNEALPGKGVIQDGNQSDQKAPLEMDHAFDIQGIMESTNPPFEELAEANKVNPDAEFELDSSPLGSSSSDTTTDTCSSDDSDADDSDGDDYEMLSPGEEARRLMAEDGADDRPGKAISGVPRTLNEKPDEIVPKPVVVITAGMEIEELGRVENTVENLILIKANTSGEYQVLEAGSVLCLEDKSVIGVVAETLGRVQQPYYSVRFTNAAAIAEAGLSQNTKVFYVGQFSKTVFTQPLRAFKGSDASNLHDEEIGDDELEFSDDEAEAEHKRLAKLQKRARFDAKHGQADGFSLRPQRSGKPTKPQNERTNTWSEQPPNANELSLNYDDMGEESDGLYTPLARPSNLHEIMARRDVPTENPANRGNVPRGGRGRGRGERGGSRGNRQRGNDRGGRSDRRGQKSAHGSGHPHAHPSTGQQSSPSAQSNGSGWSPENNLPPRPPNQSNGFHSHPQRQQSPMQPPSYPAHPSPGFQAHPSYPSQYSPSYGHSHPQQYQQPQYPPDRYLQGISRQGHFSQQAFSPGLQYQVQQLPPTPPSTAPIPPGAHVNPNFFRQQAQNSPQSWYQQQGPASSPPQQYQQYQQPSPANSNVGPVGQMSPEAARRLQENLNALKGFGRGGSSRGF